MPNAHARDGSSVGTHTRYLVVVCFVLLIKYFSHHHHDIQYQISVLTWFFFCCYSGRVSVCECVPDASSRSARQTAPAHSSINYRSH